MAEWDPEQEQASSGQREYACMPFELRALEVALDIVRAPALATFSYPQNIPVYDGVTLIDTGHSDMQ